MKEQKQKSITSQVVRFTQTALRYTPDSLWAVAILNGEAEVKRFSSVESFTAGDVFFVNAKEVWSMSSRDGCVAELVEIQCSLLPRYSYPHSDRLQLVSSLGNADQKREVSLVYRDCIFLKDLLEAWRLFSSSEAADRQQLMEEKLVSTLTLEYNVQNEQLRPFRPIDEEKFVRYYRIVDYIIRHLDQKLTLQQAAEAENMQKSYFAQMWKQNNNRTFLECINQYRLKEAERQLLFTETSNAQICQQCGFSDSKYFYRNFQAEFHMTPVSWKSRWSVREGVDETRLEGPEAEAWITQQQCQLDYVKTDTRLYQQYLLIRQSGLEQKSGAELQLNLDLYHPDNYLLLDSQRILTWYGFDLLMNVVRVQNVQARLQLRMESLMKTQDQDEFRELILQYYSRFGTRVTKNWQFELICRQSEEIAAAEKLKKWLEKNLAAAKCLCVLS